MQEKIQKLEQQNKTRVDKTIGDQGNAEEEESEDMKKLKERLKKSLLLDEDPLAKIPKEPTAWVAFLFGIRAPDQRMGKEGSRCRCQDYLCLLRPRAISQLPFPPSHHSRPPSSPSPLPSFLALWQLSDSILKSIFRFRAPIPPIHPIPARARLIHPSSPFMQGAHIPARQRRRRQQARARSRAHRKARARMRRRARAGVLSSLVARRRDESVCRRAIDRTEKETPGSHGNSLPAALLSSRMARGRPRR